MSTGITPNAAGDVVAGGAIVSTLLGYLPAAAAILGVVWYAIQIWESKTVQEWRARRTKRHKELKIIRLRAKQKVLVAELDALEVVRAAQATATEKVETAKAAAAVDKVLTETNTAISDAKK